MRSPNVGVIGLVGVTGLVAALLLAGCGVAANDAPASVPIASAGPAAGVGGAVAQARGAIGTALAGVAVQLTDSTRPYRPPEASRLREAPRAVFQLVLPDEPDGGFLVVYQFADAAAAVDAGNEEAGYLGTGPARVQFPRDAQHVLRELGPTLIIFSWSPQDPAAGVEGQVAAALGSLGVGFTVPN